MNRIRVSLTNQGRVLAIPCPSSLPSLLQHGEEVIRDWFYNKPRGLENFFKEHPEEEELFAKGFAYWVLCRVFGKQENQDYYGLLKRELKEFSLKLFRSVRSLAGRIAEQIILFRKKLKGKNKPKQIYVNRHSAYYREGFFICLTVKIGPAIPDLFTYIKFP